MLLNIRRRASIALLLATVFLGGLFAFQQYGRPPQPYRPQPNELPSSFRRLNQMPNPNVQRHSEKYEWEMEDPVDDPPDAGVKSEFTFARLRYRSWTTMGAWESWGTDANKSERQFIMGLRRLTRVNARSVEDIVDIDSDEIYNWPWLYAVEPARWEFSMTQAKRLREYFDRGGFLVVDDFHGEQQWDLFMQLGLQRVFPDRQVLELENGDHIFHVVFDLEKRFQVPGAQYLQTGSMSESGGIDPHWRVIRDTKGHIQVAIIHNQDIGDAWEWADRPEYEEKWANLAYRIGVNYVVYSLTH